MNVQPNPNEMHIVFTNKARCRDCYRCIRVCPVKAIRMHAGQASVEADRCVACGTCIRECPQGAKSFRDDIDRVTRLVASGKFIACSVAPSFAAAYPAWQRRRLPSALRRLGFRYVGETAIGAYHVAKATAEHVEQSPEQQHICTACPAVVNYVERYRPEAASSLTPIVSPMIAHAKRLRERFGNDIGVVFIGPCVAKKAEADRPEFEGLVDGVLTFQELHEWLERAGVVLSSCEESDFDEKPTGDARLFPLEGGSVRTAGWSADLLAADVVAVAGFDAVRAALDAFSNEDSADAGAPRVLEPLFCSHGCVGGPAMPTRGDDLRKRGDVLAYADAFPGERADGARESVDLTTRFDEGVAIARADFREEDIRRVLAKTGKATEENELNCGACGYATCREKAIAVLQGLAEPEMCMPYMKRVAEQRVDRIIETSPNGIVILDQQLRILSTNPAFQKYFMCTPTILGKPISYLMDPEPFDRLVAGQETLIEQTVEHERYGLVCHQIMYPLEEELQYVGIFVNVTRMHKSQQELDELRAQVVLQARDLLRHQIDMAETIASCLGRNTAQGESLLDKLMLLAKQGGPNSEGNGR